MGEARLGVRENLPFGFVPWLGQRPPVIVVFPPMGCHGPARGVGRERGCTGSCGEGR